MEKTKTVWTVTVPVTLCLIGEETMTVKELAKLAKENVEQAVDNGMYSIDDKKIVINSKLVEINQTSVCLQESFKFML